MENKERGFELMLHLSAGTESFGPGTIELLERVDREHSLRKATASMNMAYSKAWKVLKNAESTLGFDLINATTGGKGGGGAELTEEARRLVADYRRFEADVNAFAKEDFIRIFGKDDR